MKTRIRLALIAVLLTAATLARIVLLRGEGKASPRPHPVQYRPDGSHTEKAGDINIAESTLRGNAGLATRVKNTTGLSSPATLVEATAPEASTAVAVVGNGNGHDGGSGEGEPDRVYLNKLVAETVEGTDDQRHTIAFLKTHKTGSTTLASILFRYALRHGVKLANFGETRTVISINEAVDLTQERNETLDIMHYHLTGKGRLESTWGRVMNGYRRIMTDPENIYWLTLLREPREHLLSYYYYFWEPETKVPIEAFLSNAGPRRKFINNTLASEFGVTNEAEALDFVQNDIPSFSLMILSERMDEGLMMLRRDLGWQMVDMTYSVLLETKAGERRGWDGRELKNRPRFSELPKQAQDTIDSLTTLDRMLYDAAKEEFEKRLERLSDEIRDDMRAFTELQSVCNGYMDANSSSGAKSMYRGVNPYRQDPQFRSF